MDMSKTCSALIYSIHCFILLSHQYTLIPTMKISLDINIVFIKKLAEDPLAKTCNGQMFLSAVADGIQEVQTAPNTHSKKRNQDPSKEGNSMYLALEELSASSKHKKAKTDCRNAMEKDAVAVPRRIGLANMPTSVSIVSTRA